METSIDLQSITYLDNAATTYPKPHEILSKAVEDYWRYGVNPGRSGYDLCLVAGELVHKARRRLAEFLGGGNPNQMVWAYNASDALNLLIQGVLQSGDHAIATNLEHNSVIRPLNHLQRDGGVEVDYVPFGPDGLVDPDDIARLFKKNTKLVAVNHGSNVIGTIQPIGRIGALCRERGVLFAVDAAQTAGMVPINIEEMNIDAVAVTGHKSLLSTPGIGGLYVRDEVPIRGTRSGGTGVKSAYPYHLDEFPYRLEVGTPNILGIAGFLHALDWIEARGRENIFRHEMELFARLQAGLQNIDGVTLYGTTSLENRQPVLSFNIEGMDAADVGTILDVEFNVATRTGLHCAPLVHEQLGTAPRGTVRMSLGPLSEDKDVQVGLGAVKQIAGEFRRK